MNSHESGRSYLSSLSQFTHAFKNVSPATSSARLELLAWVSRKRTSRGQ